MTAKYVGPRTCDFLFIRTVGLQNDTVVLLGRGCPVPDLEEEGHLLIY